MSAFGELPPGARVFERGWLSANNIFFDSGHETALVDSGYCTHAVQTVGLVDRALNGRALGRLLNTHLHSDHCGGNAALQARHPALHTLIPPGQAALVEHWDPVGLGYEPTGQHCPPFKLSAVLTPGTDIVLGDRPWQIHAAPGHDAHSIVLFEPQSRALISADALWENGFGVVFQELEGDSAFDEVAATLDLIEDLRPALVIPGHGSIFTTLETALAASRGRLEAFAQTPIRHANHAAKVLLKFKLLELQRVSSADLARWAVATPYLTMVHRRWFACMDINTWVVQLIDDLTRSGAVRREDDMVLNA